MKKGNLPTINAKEPDEEARQPEDDVITSPVERTTVRKFITFEESTQSTEKTNSQSIRSSYKEILSQPMPGLGHQQKLHWLQKRRSTGLWVQCDDCDKWRFLPHVLDSHELPTKWYCTINPDRTLADCSIPEIPIPIRDEEDLIHSEYSAGSVVWARMSGWPWWPAMVDDCPDTEQYYWLDGFSDIPTYYNVVFFDTFEVTRAWIVPENLKPYGPNKTMSKLVMKGNRKYKQRLEVAATQANDALKLSLPDRLQKYSFINRYRGSIRTPKKVTKRELKNIQKKLKRKFDIEFPIESETEDEESIISTPPKTIKKKNNVNKKSKNENSLENNISKAIPTNTKVPKSPKGNTNKTDDSKQTNSLAVVVGSVQESTTVCDSVIENDTSTTYVPDTENQITSTQPQSDYQLTELRIASPCSDDFDF